MKSKAIDELSSKFELIQQFRNSSPETNLELIKIINDFKESLDNISKILKREQTISNWKYCKINDKKCIDGIVIVNDTSKLILEEVIYFEEGTVRTKDNLYILGKELKM